jgi:signal peptidase I
MRDTTPRHGRTTGNQTGGRRKSRRLRGTFSGLMVVLAVCALAWCGFQTGTGRWHATPVLSGSMRPGLQPGDIVVTQRVPVSDLHVRDVIVFQPPNEGSRQTVHRIVKLTVKHGTTVITTRGDANTVNDPAVTALRGTTTYRVARVVPLVGYPAVWLSGGHHGLLAIGLGLLLLIVAVVVLLRPQDRSEGNPLDEGDEEQDDEQDDADEDDHEDVGRVAVPTP